MGPPEARLMARLAGCALGRDFTITVTAEQHQRQLQEEREVWASLPDGVLGPRAGLYDVAASPTPEGGRSPSGWWARCVVAPRVGGVADVAAVAPPRSPSASHSPHAASTQPRSPGLVVVTGSA
eukprot:gene4842-30938_t